MINPLIFIRRTKHDWDCRIYSSVLNGRDCDGICSCGYGNQQLVREDNPSQIFSDELIAKLQSERGGR